MIRPLYPDLSKVQFYFPLQTWLSELSPVSSWFSQFAKPKIEAQHGEYSSSRFRGAHSVLRGPYSRGEGRPASMRSRAGAGLSAAGATPVCGDVQCVRAAA